MSYIVAASTPWHRPLFDEMHTTIKGNGYFAATEEELSLILKSHHDIDYILFMHWSHIVPNQITDRYQCICFHMTDLPFGRGGSPLQNLILNGNKSTKITAIKMNEELDAGPIYLKKHLSLEGNAHQIFKRAAIISWEMAKEIITNNLQPQKQVGKATYFTRRKPEQSEIPDGLNIEQTYDFIRMLDAPGYPKAFIVDKGHTYTFENATMENGQLKASVTINLTKK